MLNNKLYGTLVIMMKVNIHVLAVLVSCEKQVSTVFCNNKDN